MTASHLYARAVIAAARVYGDDPVRACTARSGWTRRAIAPAVLALAGVLQRDVRVVARSFGMALCHVVASEKKARGRFREAQCAAEGALLAWVDPLADVAPPAPPPITEPPPAPAPSRLAQPRMLAPARVRREVLAALGDEPRTGPDLMQLVGVGEGQVREALGHLRDEGRVTATALTQEGWAAQFWRLAGADA